MMKKIIRNLIDEVLHNFWLKMIALILAVLTWLYITGQIVKR